MTEGYVVIHRGKRHVHSCDQCHARSCECFIDARRAARTLNLLLGGNARVERFSDGVLLSSHSSVDCREKFVNGAWA